MHAEVAKMYSKNKSYSFEIVKKEKESCAGFAVPPQATNVTTAVSEKC